MGTDTLAKVHDKTIRYVFIAVILVLPMQFIIAYQTGQLYPCIKLPDFGPVLDDGDNIFYMQQQLYAVTETDTIEVQYKQLFHALPEHYARHTMNMLFSNNDISGVHDKTLYNWYRNELIHITNDTTVKALLVVTTDHLRSKEDPSIHSSKVLINSEYPLQ